MQADVLPYGHRVSTGTDTVFSYTFYLESPDEVEAFLNGAQVTNFVVSGAGSPGGFTLTFSSPPAAGTLFVRRRTPDTQMTDFVDHDALPAESLEGALDKLRRSIQEVNEELSRRPALSLSVPQVQRHLSLPPPEALKLLAWNADLSGLINVDSALSESVDAEVLVSQIIPASITELPNPGSAGRARLLMDAYRGLAIENGTQWLSMTHQVYNVTFFGARGVPGQDATAALASAIGEVNANKGGTLYFPDGVYEISAALPAIGYPMHLVGVGGAESLVPSEGLGQGSVLVATAPMASMLTLRSAVSGSGSAGQQRGGSIQGLCLEGNGQADWGITVDGWRGHLIANNHAQHFLQGFMRTAFTGETDYALGRILYNTVHKRNDFIDIAETPYFLQAVRANGRQLDECTILGNQHNLFAAGPGSATAWSIELNACSRNIIADHFAQPREDTGAFDGIIWVHNSAGGAGGISRGPIIRDLRSEWGTQIHPCILVDADFAGGGSPAVLQHVRIDRPKCQPNNCLVRLNASGNGAVRDVVIRDPLMQMTADDTIEILSSEVSKVAIWARTSTGSQLDTQIINSGGSTTLFINGVASRSLAHSLPSEGALDVGSVLYDSDSHRFWGMGHDGQITAFTAGAVERAQVWVTASAPAAQAPVGLPTNTYLLRAAVHVTEAFNGTPPDLVCGTTEGGTNVFMALDVSTPGIKTVTLAGQAGFLTTSRAIHGTFLGTGATTGKALIVVEWTRVMPQPA